MKKIIFFLWVLFLPFVGFSKERPRLYGIPHTYGDMIRPSDATPVPWFGEKLEYKISWGFLTVGEADIWVKKVVNTKPPSYYLVSTAQSSSFIDTFFRVRDINESWIDIYTLTSRGYSKTIREGSWLWDEWVAFYPGRKKLKFKEVNREGEESREQTKELSGPVQDIFSSLYYIRGQKLEVGKEFKINVNTKKDWPLVVKVLEKNRVKVPAGTFTCYVVEPFLLDKGLFVQKGKSLKIWLTADEHKIPVMMKAEVFIGHVTVKLVKVVR